jgi:hypothetical protein
MCREDLGNIQLKGPDRSVWRKTYLPELVALDAQKSGDALTGWVTTFIVDIYHYLIGQHTRKVRPAMMKGYCTDESGVGSRVLQR